MERNSNHNRGGGGGGGDGLLLRSATGQNIVSGGGGGGATRSPITSSPDLVLQWGNRKRLRCSKVQLKDRDGGNNKIIKDSNTNSSIKRNDSTGSIPAHRTTPRVDRRVIRSDFNKDPNLNPPGFNGGTTGYINLRQRSASPAQRILRNSESSIAMRGHRNGLSTAEGGGGGGAGQDVKINGNNHHVNHQQQGINYNNNNKSSNNHHLTENNNNGSGSSDSKKGGGSGGGSSSGSDAIPAVWPPKFVIGLTNKEKEEDFLAIKGSKLPQRPKKRAKGIQRNLNLVSPGAWLCDLTLERYEVREKKVTKKRPRGLKHMGNIDSDSE